MLIKGRGFVIFLAACVCALTSGPVYANGTWGGGTGDIWASGQVYVQAEHPDISLVNELLSIRLGEMASYSVHYEYSNSSKSAVVVRCGFPLEIKTHLSKSMDGDWHSSLGIDFLRSVLLVDAMPVGRGEYGNRRSGASPDTIEAVLKRIDAGAEIMRERSFADVSEGLSFLNFTIEHDGLPVDPDSCFIQIRSGGKPEDLVVRFNVMYDLRFEPGRPAFTDITYSVPSFKETRGGEGFEYGKYAANYILGTARTWKGPIGSILVSIEYESYPGEARLPGELILSSEMTSVDRRDGGKGSDLFFARGLAREFYLASDYEPRNDDAIEIEYGFDSRNGYEDDYGTGEAEETPKPLPPRPAVTRSVPPDPKIPELITGPLRGNRKGTVDCFEDAVTSYRSDFSPQRAADGLFTTAWASENQDAALEVTLTRPVMAIRLVPGFFPISAKYLDAHSPYLDESTRRDLEPQVRPWFLDEARMALTVSSGAVELKPDCILRNSGWHETVDLFLPPGKYRIAAGGPISEIEFVAAEEMPAGLDPRLKARGSMCGVFWTVPGVVLSPCDDSFSSESLLRLRSSPDLSGIVTGRLREGEKVRAKVRTLASFTVDGIKAPWYYVMRENGTYGWCFGGYLVK